MAFRLYPGPEIMYVEGHFFVLFSFAFGLYPSPESNVGRGVVFLCFFLRAFRRYPNNERMYVEGYLFLLFCLGVGPSFQFLSSPGRDFVGCLCRSSLDS